jgi:hypothetical protein
MKYTRRNLGKMVAAVVPAVSVLTPRWMSATVNSKINGVQIGTITYSFKQDVHKPDDIISDLVKIGLSSVELMSDDGERMAGAPAIRNFGFGVRLNPEQQSAVDEDRRLRTEWRAKITPEAFENVRQMFDHSGISLRILCYNMSADIADEEIDHAFRMAQALQVAAISSTSTVQSRGVLRHLPTNTRSSGAATITWKSTTRTSWLRPNRSNWCCRSAGISE